MTIMVSMRIKALWLRNILRSIYNKNYNNGYGGSEHERVAVECDLTWWPKTQTMFVSDGIHTLLFSLISR